MPSIHQEVEFAATPERVYRALTQSDEFARFTGGRAEFTAVEGGAFSCFGGLITGRFVQLVPDTRIVQAWRVFDWPEGNWSILRFGLSAGGAGTKLVFDQHGVPGDHLQHVEPGWHLKYWEPLRKHLAK